MLPLLRFPAGRTHSVTGRRQALLLAWGFGRYAPEASVGMSRDSEKTLRLRSQRREALAPAPVHEEISAL